jgi:hypothetical protein
MRLFHRLGILAPAGLLAVNLLGASAPVASAYGTEHLYQVTLSENCQNPVTCVASAQNPFGIGGIWGWIEPDGMPGDKSGMADAQLQFQGHQNAQAFLNGAGHITGPLPWSIVSSAQPLPGSPPDPNGKYFSFLLSTGGQTIPFATPATPGQYQFSIGPGDNLAITITQMH